MTLETALLQNEELGKVIQSLELRIASLQSLLMQRDRVNEAQRKQIEALEKRNEELERRLNQDSTNSSKPPSSDSPFGRKKRKRRGRGNDPSGRKAGGQPGHPGAFRELVSEEQVQHTQDEFPVFCEECGAFLENESHGHPQRIQVVDLPQVEAEVTEYRLHAVRCHRCGKVTRAQAPKKAQRPWGTNLEGTVAWWIGACRLSRRLVQTMLRTQWGVKMSLGAIHGCEQHVSAALKKPYEQAEWYVPKQGRLYADETGLREGKNHAWLWVVSSRWVKLFRVDARRNHHVAKELLGDFQGILHSDRHGAYRCHPMEKRQACWSHLRRGFVALSERTGKDAELGQSLVDTTDTMFHLWHAFQDGELLRAELSCEMSRVSERTQSLLEQGTRSECNKTARHCASVLKYQEALWTFVHHEDVEPTNNQAERDLRHAVLLKKLSHGTRSPAGSRFLERILTVTASLTAQGRKVLDFLAESLRAHQESRSPPCLLPSSTLG